MGLKNNFSKAVQWQFQVCQNGYALRRVLIGVMSTGGNCQLEMTGSNYEV